MLKILVMVSGGGTNLQAILDRITDGSLNDVQIVGVISNKKDAYALERAKKYGISAICVSKKDFPVKEEFNQELIKQVDTFSPDLIVLAGFLVILPKELITKYENKIINIHPSLIPSFCGAGCYGLKVHEMVLERGCKVTGATVHFVDDGTDTGPILLQKAVQVHQMDTPETLQKRVMEEAEWILLPEAIRLIAAGKVKVNGKQTEIME